MHSSTEHWRPSLQFFSLPGSHSPSPHLSLTVQPSPSLQDAPSLSLYWQRPLTQESLVQMLPSSHWPAVWQGRQLSIGVDSQRLVSSLQELTVHAFPSSWHWRTWKTRSKTFSSSAAVFGEMK